MTAPESLFGSKESYEKLKRIIDQARLDPEFNRKYIEADARLAEEEADGIPPITDDEMMEFVQQMQHENELYRIKKLSGI